MDTIFIHANTALGRKVQELEAQGCTVVNAPRPLAGVECWQGEWHHGRFYAYGDYETHKRSWEADDADMLLVVTDAEIEERLRLLEDPRGEGRYDTNVARYAEIGMDGIKYMAETHNLPHSRTLSASAREQLGWQEQ